MAVHASAKTRYSTLSKEVDVDVPLDSNDFESRDKRELDIGISEAIALADEVVSNNNLTKEEFKAQGSCNS